MKIDLFEEMSPQDASWADLGAILGSMFSVFYLKTQCFVNIDVFERISFQDASWVDLGPIWVAKRAPRGGLWGLKLG